MAFAIRCLSVARTFPRHAHTRLISTSRMLKTDAPPNLGTTQPQKKPIGGFRGGIVGFLFGFSLASSFAAYHLLEEYQQASAALQASVETLQINTEKISAHVRRIEAVEKDLKALNQTSASKDDISRVRTETKKLFDGLHLELIDLQAHVWGIEQDIQALSKKDNSVRI